MNLSEYLSEGILSKKTGMYDKKNELYITKDMSFLQAISVIDKKIDFENGKHRYFDTKPYVNGYQPYSSKTLDMDKLGKELSSFIGYKAKPVLRVDENGGFFMFWPADNRGYYLGWWGNGGKLNQIVAVGTQFRNEFVIDYDYPGSAATDIGLEEFNDWLDEIAEKLK